MANASAGRSALSRIMQILGTFDVDSAFLTVSQLSQRSGLSLATTHRVVTELEQFGLLERERDKTYRIGVRLWEIACRTPGALGIREIAMPYLQEIHFAVRQHAQLGILQGHEVLFLERLSTRNAVVNVTLIGGRLPLHASSSGLVLLAHAPGSFQAEVLASGLVKYTEDTVQSPAHLRRLLAQIREQGHAVGNGFIHPDARGIAVPVYGLKETVVAAISVVVPNDTAPALPTVRLLKDAARQVSTALQAAYLPLGDPGSPVGGNYRTLVHSSRHSMEFLGQHRKDHPQ